MPSLVQSANGIASGSTTTTATFGATPTQNNLMTAQFFTGADASPGNPSGWTTAVELFDTPNADWIRISYKVAGASEPTAVSFTTNVAGGSLGIFEFSGMATSNVLDQTASTAPVGATTISSGTTGSTVQASEVSVVCFSFRGVPTSPSLSNAFTLVNNAADTDGKSVVDGYKVETAAGAKESTCSWTGAQTAMGAIATFKAATTASNPAFASTIFRSRMREW